MHFAAVDPMMFFLSLFLILSFAAEDAGIDLRAARVLSRGLRTDELA